MQTVYYMDRGNGYIVGEARVATLDAETLLAAAPAPAANPWLITRPTFTGWRPCDASDPAVRIDVVVPARSMMARGPEDWSDHDVTQSIAIMGSTVLSLRPDT